MPNNLKEKSTSGTQFDALARRAALAGRTLLQTSDGFLVAKLTHAKHCAHLDAAKVVIRGLEAEFKRGLLHG